MREVVAWIGTHLPEDLAVEALAQRGCTPARFVEQARVATAAQLLVRTQWTQDRIASRSGFGSVDALQRAFVRQRAVTPQAYRHAQRPPVKQRDGEGPG